MLHRSCIEAVTALTETAVESGVVIRPLPNTPLALAIQAGYDAAIETTQGLSVFDIGGLLEAGSQRANQGGGYPHDDAIAVTVDMVSQTVEKNLLLARTVVNPQIKSVVGKVEELVNAADLSAMTPITILPDYFDGVWAANTLETLVEKFIDAPVANRNAPIYFPVKTPDEIVGLLKTGSSNFDREVETWVASLGADFFVSVYQQFFQIQTGLAAATTLSDFAMPAFEKVPSVGRNRALAIFLMARSLKSDAPEGYSAGLAKFQEEMALLMEQAGRIVGRAVQRRKDDIKAGMLVVVWPGDARVALSTGAIITVIGETYNQWLTKGGSPEILLGSYVSDGSTNPLVLLEKQDQYKEAWNRSLLVLKSKANSQRFNATVTGIVKGVEEIILSLTEDEYLTVNKGELHKRLHEAVSTLSANDCADVYHAVRRVVCYTLYPHTDAEKVLKAIDKATVDNPELAVREAALYATIEMLADWLLKLMEVKVQGDSIGNNADERRAAAMASLCNAVEIGVEVVMKIAGNDISNQIGGQDVNSGILAQAIALKFQNKLQHLLNK